MRLDRAAISRNLETLRFFALHDAVISFLFVCTIFYSNIILGVFVFLFPFLEFFWAFFRNKSIDSFTLLDLKRKFSLGDRVIIKQSQKEFCQAYSLPFLKMILLSKDSIEAFDDKEHFDSLRAHGVIAHECGHLKQYDRMIFRWVQLGLIFTFFGFFYTILMFLLEDASILQNERRWIFEGSTKTIIIFLTIAFMMLTLRRVAHRREHIADLEGLRLHLDGILEFINDGIDFDDSIRHSNSTRLNRETHPSFYKRAMHLINSLPVDDTQVRSVASMWTIFIWFALPGFIDQERSGVQILFASFMTVLPFVFIAKLKAEPEFIKLLLKEYALGVLFGIFSIYVYSILYQFLDTTNGAIHMYSELGVMLLAMLLVWSVYLLSRSLVGKRIGSKRLTGTLAGVSLAVFAHIALMSFCFVFYGSSRELYHDIFTELYSGIFSFFLVGVFCYLGHRLGGASTIYFWSLNEKIQFSGWEKLSFYLFLFLFSTFFYASLKSIPEIPIKAESYGYSPYSIDTFAIFINHAVLALPFSSALWVIVCMVVRGARNR